MAMIFCNGGLVILAGLWERSGVSVVRSWQWAIGAGIAIYVVAWGYAIFVMPHSALDHAVAPARGESRRAEFGQALKSFFTQRGAMAIVGFFIFYRFAESMLTKVSGLFLLDSRSVGGLGFDTVQAGAILGNVGIIALVAGGILGGVLIARFGLKNCLWPMVVTMNLPNLFYVWAARTQPGPTSMVFITAIEQFSYGFGMAAYLVYAMEISRRSRFQTSHYAITAALMALGAMIAGALSGLLQVSLGYFGLFVMICLLTIPGMLLLKFIPLEDEGNTRGLVPAGLD